MEDSLKSFGFTDFFFFTSRTSESVHYRNTFQLHFTVKYLLFTRIAQAQTELDKEINVNCFRIS